MELLVRVVNGRWARTTDHGWLFIANPREASPKLKIRQGDGFIRIKEMVMDAFSMDDDDDDMLNLTFQWPEWLDLGGGGNVTACERSCPVKIHNDETMELYLALSESKELPLYISQVSVENSVDANALEILEEKVKYVMEIDVDYDFNYDVAFETLSVDEIVVGDDEYEGDAVFVGRVFRSKNECQATLSKHALNSGFRFRLDCLCKKLTTLACLSDSCPWRVYIVKLEFSDGYQIVSANLRHTCSVQDCGQEATTKFIESLKKSKIDLKKHIDDHNAKASRLRKWKSGFGLLPTYLYLVPKDNPGSVTHVHTEDNKFKRLFLAYSASLKGFLHMRRVITLGAAPLTAFPGCLLTASSQDANFQAFPLAFAVVDEDNEDAWKWFFRKLVRVIPDSNDLTFVSKWDFSIYTTIRGVYRKATHGACAVHLQQEVTAIFKNRRLSHLVSEAACAYRLDEFQAAFTEIRRIEPECAEYLEDIGLSNWTRAHFTGQRYNMMTSNVAEFLNAALKDARSFPIIKLLDYIRTALMIWFAKRRAAATAETSRMSTNARKLI